MKKVLAAILAFLYLSTSLGATLHLHYCMGKLVSWGLINHERKTCALCVTPEKTVNPHCIAPKKGCCQDDQKQIKTGCDQKISPSEFHVLKFSPDVSISNHHELPDIAFSAFIPEHPASTGPPIARKVPVFILNCNFRI